MKRSKIYFVISILFVAFAFSNCKKDKDKMSCEEAEMAILTKGLTFWGEETVANCEAYRNALEDGLDACSSEWTAEEKEDALEDLETDCSDF